ncbi:MAG: hypothetical protein H6Q65_984 [Firmicutes bacterium]|nr:hypothetical protein [Bacillota bacterium]
MNHIDIIYGTDPGKMIYQVLEKIQLAKELKPDTNIAIKPNLVVAKPCEQGATTTPALVEGVIRYLKKHGFHNISIMESSWVGENTKRAFNVCGYDKLSQKYNVPLYDLKEDSTQSKQIGELNFKICNKPLQTDFLINIPVLKAHCQTLFTCALKNLKGCIPDTEKRRFHSLGLSKPIGYLGKVFPPGLIIVDAISGDLTFEEGGNPVHMDRIIVGKDPVMIDTYCASLIGYSKDEIEYIPIAEQMGVGSSNLAQAILTEHDIDLKNNRSFIPSNKAKELAKKVSADQACSACYGSLIHALQRLREKNKLSSIKGPIHIGQGFRGKTLEGLGIGSCTKHCSKHISGCPPTAKSILDFLENNPRL